MLRTEDGKNIGQGRIAPMPHMKLAMILPDEEIQLQQGEKIVVYFDGQDIADNGTDGTYKVTVYIRDDKDQFICSIEYMTQYYKTNAFGIN